jgi:hypothetical protein
MSTAVKETLLRKVDVLPANLYPKVLNYIETLENGGDENKQVSFSAEEWDEFCDDFKRSPEEALEKAYSRGWYTAPQQS